MNLHSTRRLGMVLLCSALLTSACGLKSEVKDSLQAGGGVGAGTTGGGVIPEGSVTQPDGTIVAPDGTIVAGPGGGSTTGGSTTGGSTTGGSTTGGSTGGSTGVTSGSGGSGSGGSGAGSTTGAPAGETLGPDSKVGIDDRQKTIKIFLHGPLTGAGVPQNSFISGTPRYWNEGPGGKPRLVKGYRVIAQAVDDKYAPGPAVKICNEKAKEGFLILGGAGTDQIQACARSQVLRRGNVPYISAGVTTNGLTGLGHYFASSLTYAAQAKLVVDMAQKGNYLKPANGKGWGVVVSNTPNFADAEQAIVAALKAAGQPVTVIRTPKTGGDSTAVTNQLREQQLQSVYFLGQPTFFIELVGKAGCPAYCPQWAGVGVSMGTNSIGSLACRGSGNQYKGEFLSPAPGLDKAAELAPGVSFADDIEFGIYATMQVLEKMLLAVPGPSFTRESFIRAVEGKKYKGTIIPESDFTKGHFGGTAAYALKMDCGAGRHTTNGFYN